MTNCPVGGVSRSALRFDPAGHAVFAGLVSADNNGGFASVRSAVVHRASGEFDPEAFDAIELDVRGDAGLMPRLAESWEDKGNGTWQFKLRQGVKWQSNDKFTPTRDFNADDVIFSYDRQGNAENPWHQYIAGITYEYYTSMAMPELIKSIEKVDDYTVKFTLNQPEAPFLANLAMQFAGIQSKEYAIAMLKAAAGQREIRFIHACKNAAHHSFKNLTEQLSTQHSNITAEYIYENQQGLINPQTIQKNLPDNAQVYFLGPVGFMSAVKNMLSKLGVPAERQHFEFFGPAQAI